MRFVIVTGMSGAGKSTALKILEDEGYFCADNLPIPLVEKFADLAFTPEREYNKVALGVDIRSGREITGLQSVLEQLTRKGLKYEILYLDARDGVLVKRYKETRRSHPLARSGRLEEGIRAEREALAFLKKQADYILDTSNLLTRELREAMAKIFVNLQEYKNIFITVLSFGFKYGIPGDSDLVFDVRFLPNPYYVPELKHKTGEDQEVQDYVMGFELSHRFLEKLEDMIEFLLPNYVSEGKNQLVISIGCTGGKHRSVTLAEKLFQYLGSHAEYGVKLEHRDIRK
ncbi:MAG TPA: RNase adapter RapZ [Candidatus Choladousia intestinavium]|uniref:RNase adapter RapZ n=1 Tax=Candidatus Choladousia intestinavium TaxID=2840727 RepID=A0A9D1D967_9FIRM|nr:RNase adapter RapZ [Candidatus Choladousia intestinavium]